MGLTVFIDDAEQPEINRRFQSATIIDSADADADECTLAVAADLRVSPPRQGAKIQFLFDRRQIGGLYTVNRVSADSQAGVMEISGAEFNLNSDLVSAENKQHAGDLKSILNFFADRFALTPEISDALGAMRPLDPTQRAETPLQFLRRLAQDANANFTVKGGRLLFLPADAGDGTGGTQLPTVLIDAESTENWISYDITDRVSQKIKVQFFTADKTTIAEKIIGDGDVLSSHPQIFPNEAAADTFAAAAISKLKPETQTIRADIPLSPHIRAGFPLRVINLPAGLSENFKISQISHFFSNGNLAKSQIIALFAPFK